MGGCVLNTSAVYILQNTCADFSHFVGMQYHFLSHIMMACPVCFVDCDCDCEDENEGGL